LLLVIVNQVIIEGTRSGHIMNSGNMRKIGEELRYNKAKEVSMK
jgi:hypothetical protein